MCPPASPACSHDSLLLLISSRPTLQGQRQEAHVALGTVPSRPSESKPPPPPTPQSAPQPMVPGKLQLPSASWLELCPPPPLMRRDAISPLPTPPPSALLLRTPSSLASPAHLGRDAPTTCLPQARGSVPLPWGRKGSVPLHDTPHLPLSAFQSGGPGLVPHTAGAASRLVGGGRRGRGLGWGEGSLEAKALTERGGRVGARTRGTWMTGRGAHGGSTGGQAWRSGSGTQTEGGSAHGEQGRAHDGSSARRPAPRWAPAGSSVHPRGPGRPGSELWAEGGYPRASAFLLPPLGEGQEEATAHVGRSGKTCPCRHPPTPAPPPGPRDADKLGLPGDGGSRPNSEPLPAGPHPPRPRGSTGQGAPWLPSSKPSPSSREPASSTQPRGSDPLTCCQDLGLARPRGRAVSPGPGAQRRRARRRQVQPRPAARAGGRTQESPFAPKSGA